LVISGALPLAVALVGTRRSPTGEFTQGFATGFANCRRLRTFCKSLPSSLRHVWTLHSTEAAIPWEPR
jgi:hypothetical protein